MGHPNRSTWFTSHKLRCWHCHRGHKGKGTTDLKIYSHAWKQEKEALRTIKEGRQMKYPETTITSKPNYWRNGRCPKQRNTVPEWRKKEGLMEDSTPKLRIQKWPVRADKNPETLLSPHITGRIWIRRVTPKGENAAAERDRGWRRVHCCKGNAGAGRCLACEVVGAKVQGVEFNPQHPCEKPTMVTRVCNTGTGDADTGRFPRLTGQLFQSNN